MCFADKLCISASLSDPTIMLIFEYPSSFAEINTSNIREKYKSWIGVTDLIKLLGGEHIINIKKILSPIMSFKPTKKNVHAPLINSINKSIPKCFTNIKIMSNTNNIDTVLYQNYINGGAIDTSYGLTKATSVQKQQLQQMQTKLNLLSNQINNLTNKFSSDDQQIIQQSETNIQGLNNFVSDIKKTNKKIKNYDTTYENILQDSDIVVLQKNYDYLFWSIIAVTTVIISMNIVKK